MSQQRSVYLVRAGRDGEDEQYVLEHNLAVIGFRDFGSLEKINDWGSLSKFVRDEDPDLKPRAVGNIAGQLWVFALAIKEGDIVVLPQKLTSQIAVGLASGPYKYQKVGGEFRHTRPVNWIRTNVPRTDVKEDLLSSLGARMTCCQIRRNEAELRIAAILGGKPDPGLSSPSSTSATAPLPAELPTDDDIDLAQDAKNQIVAHIQQYFKKHDFADLVNEILRAEGWITTLSPPGPDGGVDILAGRGILGLDTPKLAVQVKSQNSEADVKIYRELQGSMQTFQADQGLLVCWGGFNKIVRSESRQRHFTIRLWEKEDLVEALLRNYHKLRPEIQAKIPLKQIWMLVPEQPAGQ